MKEIKNVGFKRAFEEGERRIIAGYASVEIKDDYGTIITREALKMALPEYMKNPILRYQHQPEPIGKVLWEYKTENGEILKTGVDDKGLFIVGEIINDPDAKKANEVWALIKNGIITGFSVGGQVLDTERGIDATYITRIKLFEVSVVDLPANEKSHFKIYRNEEIEGGNMEGNIGEDIKNWLERKSFPWDECIRKMKKEGHSDESAARICAAIKNRTVRHMVEWGLADNYNEAYKLLREKIKTDIIFGYVINRLAELSIKEKDRNLNIFENHTDNQGVNMNGENIERQETNAPTNPQEQNNNANNNQGNNTPSAIEQRVEALENAISEINNTLTQMAQKIADLEAFINQEETNEENPPQEAEVSAGVMTERKGEIKDEENINTQNLSREVRLNLWRQKYMERGE